MSVINVTNKNFQKEIINSEKTVLLDFWASWCGPCKMLSPIIDEIAVERPDIKVCKVNIDEEQELAAQYQVMSIPTLFVLKNGEITNHSVGVRSKNQILDMLE